MEELRPIPIRRMCYLQKGSALTIVNPVLILRGGSVAQIWGGHGSDMCSKNSRAGNRRRRGVKCNML